MASLPMEVVSRAIDPRHHDDEGLVGLDLQRLLQGQEQLGKQFGHHAAQLLGVGKAVFLDAPAQGVHQPLRGLHPAVGEQERGLDLFEEILVDAPPPEEPGEVLPRARQSRLETLGPGALARFLLGRSRTMGLPLHGDGLAPRQDRIRFLYGGLGPRLGGMGRICCLRFGCNCLLRRRFRQGLRRRGVGAAAGGSFAGKQRFGALRPGRIRGFLFLSLEQTEHEAVCHLGADTRSAKHRIPPKKYGYNVALGVCSPNG